MSAGAPIRTWWSALQNAERFDHNGMCSLSSLAGPDDRTAAEIAAGGAPRDHALDVAGGAEVPVGDEALEVVPPGGAFREALEDENGALAHPLGLPHAADELPALLVGGDARYLGVQHPDLLDELPGLELPPGALDPPRRAPPEPAQPPGPPGAARGAVHEAAHEHPHLALALARLEDGGPRAHSTPTIGCLYFQAGRVTVHFLGRRLDVPSASFWPFREILRPRAHVSEGTFDGSVFVNCRKQSNYLARVSCVNWRHQNNEFVSRDTSAELLNFQVL